MKKLLLTILDGWGIGSDASIDAIHQAHTPYYDTLVKTGLHSTLTTFGNSVGLPEGQMGNSEVGHMNIGAGRIIDQQLMLINNSIDQHQFRKNKTLTSTLSKARKKSKIHLMGLLSDGGVHAHIKHLKALITASIEAKIEHVYLHIFLDGRDTPPHSGISFLEDLLQFISPHPHVQLSTVIGRYYAMDRDNRWGRTKKAYDLLVHGVGKLCTDIRTEITTQYTLGTGDEFIEGLRALEDKIGLLESEDIVVMSNFRSDRPRQIIAYLLEPQKYSPSEKPLHLHLVTMTEYNSEWKNVNVIFPPTSPEMTLGEVIASHGLSQLRIAETEKYPHVTYFFNGGVESEFAHEMRIMIPSPHVATYDKQPEMSAIEVTQACIKHIDTYHPDFICLNYANTDMVGHTGVWEAVVKAAETVDQELKKLVTHAIDQAYCIVIIADHGNADIMKLPDGSPHTAHTTNLVPIIILDQNKKISSITPGILADIAPTILTLMGLPIPDNMTGKILVS